MCLYHNNNLATPCCATSKLPVGRYITVDSLHYRDKSRPIQRQSCTPRCCWVCAPCSETKMTTLYCMSIYHDTLQVVCRQTLCKLLWEPCPLCVGQPYSNYCGNPALVCRPTLFEILWEPCPLCVRKPYFSCGGNPTSVCRKVIFNCVLNAHVYCV